MNPNDTSPEQLIAELREIRKKIPFHDDGTPTSEKLDAELILRELTAIRRKIPFLDEGTPRQSEDARTPSFDDMPLETEEDFEWAAVLDGIESFASDLTAAMDRKRAELIETGLRVYYAAEEASRDPANAHLIEQVEEMRAAFERDYGRPIPPKGKK
jgi:hypothetical protein